jgi:GNAT superfamily N-acetyltransferase
MQGSAGIDSHGVLGQNSRHAISQFYFGQDCRPVPHPPPMNAPVQVVPLSRSPRDVSRFLNVSYGIYQNDPQWVAPLLMDLKKVFTDRNPFFEHADMQLWVVVQDGRDVGRIAGIEDRSFNARQPVPTAYFGFFESIVAAEVSNALFQAAFNWAANRGLIRILGPMNPSGNDECGLLAQGFELRPVFMMPYNPRYYLDLVERAGFKKSKDLVAFDIDLKHTPIQRLERVAARFAKRQTDIHFRPVRRKTLRADLAKVKEIYNEAWDDNWGFVPMTDGEIDFMAERLKPMLAEGLVWLAETDQQPVGFLLAMPDFNEALEPLHGRLASPGLFKFLPYLFRWKTPATVRVVVLGVKEAYRNRGIESFMLVEGLKTGFRLGFTGCEASWILEDNLNVRNVIERFGGKPYKIYRIYERRIEE